LKEDNHTELKREYTPEIKKSVVAFANSQGGRIYVGMDDTGQEYPIDDIDATLNKLTSGIRDGILPDVTYFVRYDIEDNHILVEVGEGSNKPYFLADKGIKPTGVYVRQGASSAQASFEQIRQMIKLTDDDIFEAERSLNQELTFEIARKEFAKQGLTLTEENMRSLGIKNHDGLYTNLGVLLSEQCKHTLKIAVFFGEESNEFKTRKEFTGSLFEQLSDGYDFLDIANNLNATFKGLERVEQYDYPKVALREGILNALVHRDYSFSGSTIINIYDNRMEFISLGGLVAGLEKNDILAGISQPRNEKLANIFYRLKHIESYGTGLKKIFSSYKEFSIQPEISVTHASFKLTLPNRNNSNTIFSVSETKTAYTPVKAQHKAVLEYLSKHELIDNQRVQKLLDIKQTRAYGVIKEMIGLGLIEKTGNYNSKEYKLVNPKK